MAVERKATSPADPTMEKRLLKRGLKALRRKKEVNKRIVRKRTLVKKIDR